MKTSKILSLIVIIILLSSCASSYKMINPNRLRYNSNDKNNGISLEYKYNLLHKKYAKKESQNDIKVVAVKITNNTDHDIVFGKDVKLEYENGRELYIHDNEKVFSTLKQKSAVYLLYLLLTPMKFYKSQNGVQTSSLSIGYVIGPGIAGGNMLVAATANGKFKDELSKYRINGETIKKGETKVGLIGIKSNNYDALRLKVID